MDLAVEAMGPLLKDGLFAEVARTRAEVKEWEVRRRQADARAAARREGMKGKIFDEVRALGKIWEW